MNDVELCFLSIAQISRLISGRVISPSDIVAAVLRRIEATEDSLGAYASVLAETAVASAAIAEREISAGKWRGPLHGVPISLKDNIHLNGVPTAGGSKVFEGFVPSHDAAVVERLKEAGATVIGKTRMWELAMRGEAEQNLGRTRNPWNQERASMGSSSGSAISVAAGSAYASIGTDTGGSIRGPASACGVVGFKPSFGLVSRYGILPVSWSLDHAGPLARTVEDCVLVMNAIAGSDRRDEGSIEAPAVDYTKSLGRAVTGLRIGVPDHLFDGIDPEIAASVDKAINQIAAEGATRHTISIPELESGRTAQTVITLAESASIYEDEIRTRPSDFGPQAREKLELGSLLLATDYLKAQRIRNLFRQRLGSAMAEVDVVITPTSPDRPPRHDQSPSYSGRLGRIEANRFRWPFSLVGAPAITVPCGLMTDGLPIGLQVAGKPMQDSLVLSVAHAYERAAPWSDIHPSL